jgi:hypothetical protein
MFNFAIVSYQKERHKNNEKLVLIAGQSLILRNNVKTHSQAC